MATKDIWRPGMKTIKTPGGHITAVPASTPDEELAELVVRADQSRLVDPAAQERDARAVIRRARWDKQVAEANAYRAFLTEQGIGIDGAYPPDFDFERHRADWTRQYRASAAYRESENKRFNDANAQASKIRANLASLLEQE